MFFPCWIPSRLSHPLALSSCLDLSKLLSFSFFYLLPCSLAYFLCFSTHPSFSGLLLSFPTSAPTSLTQNFSFCRNSFLPAVHSNTSFSSCSPSVFFSVSLYRLFSSTLQRLWSLRHSSSQKASPRALPHSNDLDHRLGTFTSSTKHQPSHSTHTRPSSAQVKRSSSNSSSSNCFSSHPPTTSQAALHLIIIHWHLKLALGFFEALVLYWRLPTTSSSSASETTSEKHLFQHMPALPNISHR